MSRVSDMKLKIVNAVLSEVREKHPASIDKAYEYFWEGQSPDEFMSGTALSLGFHNFEDWLICDYKVNEDGDTFIDLYLKNHSELESDERDFLQALGSAFLSLYEVASVAKGKHVRLLDLFRETEVELRDKTLSNSLVKGDIFAARLVRCQGRDCMSGCVYPFSPKHKKAVLQFFEGQFRRYRKNEKPDGSQEEFLKDYGDLFNIAWVDRIVNTKPQEK